MQCSKGGFPKGEMGIISRLGTPHTVGLVGELVVLEKHLSSAGFLKETPRVSMPGLDDKTHWKNIGQVEKQEIRCTINRHRIDGE